MTFLARLFSILLWLMGAAALSAAIWFGLPITEIPEVQPEPVRAALIAGVLTLVLLAMLLRYRKRRRSASALEDTLLSNTDGDSDILAERMQGAVARLKASGGATALYDLPWYVLIGPPGAGKTTALVHSGLEFPDTDPAAVAGVGGTRNCDFWFTRDAVMIDTAGRYTTQDSDVAADAASWQAFLSQIKTARPDQPINGVILAISCADMMTLGEAALTTHAKTIRARLEELQKAFRTHVPVYVIFTKADMIAGFRAFFGPFDERRRRQVWGHTFQTKNRQDDTVRAVPAAFDRLISRLSEDVTARMVDERDSATRIAIFGFPDQMARLAPTMTRLLEGVFDKGKAGRAILRGFYFTSGTQEGTPIDQVLGAMRSGAGGMAAGFLSGRGRSYFLHDLLKRVIFAERDWVGYDRRRMFRRAFFRGLGKTVIGAAAVGVMGLIGYSFWANAGLVRSATVQSQVYAAKAAPFLNQSYVDSAATRPLLPVLEAARVIPGGYTDTREQPMTEKLGLSRKAAVRASATAAYSDSLEQLLRPRMMLLVERHLAAAIADGRNQDTYRALKVYILLAKAQDGRGDDLAIQSYFAESWAAEYAAPGSDAEYRAINAHVAAMLELDDRVTPFVAPNKALVDRAREALADLTVAERAYVGLRSQAGVLPPVQLGVSGVFTPAGQPAGALSVPGLFTPEGYWDVFYPRLAAAPATVTADAWVLGRQGPPVLGASFFADVHALYAKEYEAQWTWVLDQVGGAAPDAIPALVDRVVAVTGVTRGWEDNLLLVNRNFSRPVEPAVVQAWAEQVENPFAAWHNLARAGGAGDLVATLAALPGDPDRWLLLEARRPALPAV
ncbi:MAG: type VI secretion system membrane subunit TssM, partial [Ruegeria sp.]